MAIPVKRPTSRKQAVREIASILENHVSSLGPSEGEKIVLFKGL